MNEIISRLNRLQKIGLITGTVLAVACILAVIFDASAFFPSYLFAFIFWFGLTLGCFNVAMIHYLAGGRWGFPVRRFLEAGFMTLPLMAVCFVLILFGLRELYPWSRPAAVAADKILQQKVVYENFPAFVIRAVIFFGVWMLIATRLRKWSLQQDNVRDNGPAIKMQTLSGAGVAIVPLVATFAFVDWILSLEPSWFSTIFSVILLSAGVLLALAFVIILLSWFQPYPPFKGVTTEKHFQDLGNLLLAFVMFWTYVAFSQFLIVYAGNQPHEIGWYLHRIAGGWKWLMILIAIFHFLVPFFLLLFIANKKNRHRLVTVAMLIFLISIAETYWSIAPTLYPAGFTIHWTDFAAWLAIGGFWLAIFAGNLKRHPLLPVTPTVVEKNTAPIPNA